METRTLMSLHLSFGRYGLALGNPARARLETERLLEIAAAPGDLHFLALGHRLLAQIAVAEDKAGEAEAQIAQALALIDGKTLPLAAWQVYAAATEIFRIAGKANEALGHRDKAIEIIRALTDSLDKTPEGLRLRQAFADAPAVKNLQAFG
ncbi:MAG: hypothetical protein PHT19_13775 [Methylococcus sp.]|nr:hypothetical protein [Methylococcus sp.]